MSGVHRVAVRRARYPERVTRTSGGGRLTAGVPWPFVRWSRPDGAAPAVVATCRQLPRRLMTAPVGRSGGALVRLVDGGENVRRVEPTEDPGGDAVEVGDVGIAERVDHQAPHGVDVP